MKCGVRKEVRIRRNEMVEEVKYFRCWSVGHFKWECPNIKVEKKKKDKEVVYSLWKKGYAPKECSSKRARIEDKVGDSNICGVWGL